MMKRAKIRRGFEEERIRERVFSFFLLNKNEKIMKFVLFFGISSIYVFIDYIYNK